jgi:predicted nucleic acid-binding protein
MYLVDTNVISAGAPTKARAEAALVRWMDEHSAELYVSVVTVTEIEDGIAKARREHGLRRSCIFTQIG